MERVRVRFGTVRALGWCIVVLIIAACGGQPIVRSASPPAPAGSVVAFVGVSVVPMDRERVLADQTVIVRGDRIAAIGPRATTPVPPDAVRIAAQGRFLMPGLGDMHVHLNSRTYLDLLVANGVTFVRNMWGSPAQLAWRAQIENGTLVGPHIFTTGPLMDGKPPFWDGALVVSTPAEADTAVARQKAAGYDFLKVYSRLSPEAYDAIVAAARRYHMRVVGHVPDAVGLAHALSSGQESIEHLTGYVQAIQRSDSPFRTGKQSWAGDYRGAELADERLIAKAAEDTRRAGAWNCVTLAVNDTYEKIFAGADLSGTAGLDYMSPTIRGMWARLATRSRNFRRDFDPDRRAQSDERLRRGHELHLELVRALHAAGAPILAGTDFPNPYVIPGFSLHDELDELVAAGLSPYEALRSATAAPARFLGADFGTVEVGMRADLLMLDANPLENVDATRTLEGVLISGRWHAAGELAKRLADLKARMATPSDPVAGLAPVPGSLTYEVRSDDATLGAERVVVDGSRVRAQAIGYAGDEPGAARDRLTIDGATLTLEAERAEGRVSADVHGSRVRARFADLPETELDVGLGDDVVLVGPWVASWVAIAARVADLRVGQSRELHEVVLDPLDTPTTGTLTITRKPDANGVRVLAFVDDRANGAQPTPGTITLDARGLVAIEITNDVSGTVREVRIDAP